MPRQYKLLIEHARQIVQVSNTGARALTKDAMKDLPILQGAAEGYSLLIGRCVSSHSKHDIFHCHGTIQKCVTTGWFT